MTQADLAAAVGVAQTTISQTENRVIWPSYELLAGISDALDCSPLELFVDPSQPSLDALLAAAPPEVRGDVEAMVRSLLDRRRGQS